jgi:hypothetical protein
MRFAAILVVVDDIDSFSLPSKYEIHITMKTANHTFHLHHEVYPSCESISILYFNIRLIGFRNLLCSGDLKCHPTSETIPMLSPL